ncbi:hypothetical protein EAI_12807 [Harpegnathos saltator]|uniref:Uncharacterized protein n=1 Tax=Harpegnathos saltator TaxID=610380 RepID=E2BK58_HARSA|nr:hypothetical protein EAI_12807 [Harpegnathos saltator]
MLHGNKSPGSLVRPEHPSGQCNITALASAVPRQALHRLAALPCISDVRLFACGHRSPEDFKDDREKMLCLKKRRTYSFTQGACTALPRRSKKDNNNCYEGSLNMAITTLPRKNRYMLCNASITIATSLTLSLHWLHPLQAQISEYVTACSDI